MRIAQIAPLWERVPPPAYGGIELVVGLLTDELVRRGHEVTLFATKDSQTLARLEPCSSQALRALDVTEKEAEIYHTLELNKVFKRASEFDLIHSHLNTAAFPYAYFAKTPVVHTTHWIIEPEVEPLWKDARQQNFISISDSQRRNDLGLNYVDTVYNGINPKIFPFYSQPENPPYLAFLGRMSPQKGPHLAIEIALRSGYHLKMAGKVDHCDRAFFKEKVEPYIDGKQIEFLGEANHEQKCKLMGNATATLFPITWSEPFGLVMAESMVLGTPVIAMKLGSTKEVIKDGKTGFLCHNVDECVAAIDKLGQINRFACRDRILSNFSVSRMVDGYEAVYRKLAATKPIAREYVPNLVVNTNSLTA